MFVIYLFILLVNILLLDIYGFYVFIWLFYIILESFAFFPLLVFNKHLLNVSKTYGLLYFYVLLDNNELIVLFYEFFNYED